MALGLKSKPVDYGPGLRMNRIFFTMSVFVLGVILMLINSDLHPQWLSYAHGYSAVERGLLENRLKELQAILTKKDFDGIYTKAKADYTKSKEAFDAESSKLEATDASLEEVSLRLKQGSEEGSTPDLSASADAGAAPAKGGLASKQELDDLDKEFASGSSPQTQGKNAAAKSAKASKSELDDLDKEFAGSDAPKSGGQSSGSAKSKPKQSGKSEFDDLDKEFAASDAPKGNGQGESKPAPAARSGGKSELDDLDKEFASSDAPKAADKPAATAGEKPAAPELTYEETKFEVNLEAAEGKVDSAKRDLLTAQRDHAREALGLPQDAVDDRSYSDLRLKEAEETLAVATAGVDLEEKKAVVKQAAQVALWAKDAKRLESGGKLSNDERAPLEDSKKKLDGYLAGLERELAAVKNRLAASGQNLEIQEVFVQRLGSVERCTTCHLAVEDPMFASSKEPFRTHPSQILKWHPIERFGCESCHGGFPASLNRSEAHGETAGKGRPLLYGARVQASCGSCHGDSKQLAGESAYLYGASLFKTSGCLGCHKVDSVEAPEKAGPALDRLAEKIRPEWLSSWIKNPKSHSLSSRMPNLGLSEKEAQEVATFLMSQSSGDTSTDGAPACSPSDLATGKRLIDSLGCRGCHTLQGTGGVAGPDLTGLRAKVKPLWLYAWLANPKAYLPHSRMPMLDLSKEQCRQIGNYLLSIDPPKTKAIPIEFGNSAAAAEGSKLIGTKGCAGCHDIRGFTRIAAPDLSHEGDVSVDGLDFGGAKIPRTAHDWITLKIAKPDAFDSAKFAARMPNFGLSESDSEMIAIYLSSLRSQEYPIEYRKGYFEDKLPQVAGGRVFERKDCLACHTFSGRGGKVGPDLTREGERVHPDWLFKFLKSPTRIRWWQDARMPNFTLTDDEATQLTEYFMATSNQAAPYEYAAADKLVYPNATLGLKLFADLKCQSCHPIGGKQAVAGGDIKKLGPDLGLARERLKADWVFRFLKDPQAFSPGTQMPSFQKDDATYSAIVDYLMKPTTGSSKGGK